MKTLILLLIVLGNVVIKMHVPFDTGNIAKIAKIACLMSQKQASFGMIEKLILAIKAQKQ